jgi:photosystem II stability/assembly factor-like uncharacterized protein
MESTDCGATWTAKSTGKNSDKLLTGDPWAMAIDPTNPDVIYINNGYGNDPTLYKSTNAGVDWAQLSTNPQKGAQSSVQDVAMDPNDPKHLAVSFHDNCDKPINPMCISATKDGGDTWTLINGPSALTGWQEAATLSVLGPTSYLYAAAGAWFTSDSGTSWTKVVDQGFYASYAGSTAIINGALYLTGANTVYKSTSNPLGSVFTSIPGSIHASSIVSDGTTVWAGNAWDYGGTPMYSAPLNNLSMWTKNKVSGTMGRGPYQYAYDPTHHILYSASIGAGLWRIVTQ